MKHQPIYITDLPSPSLWKQRNCWMAAIREYDQHRNRSIVLTKSRRVVKGADRWWRRLGLKYLGDALVTLSWYSFGLGKWIRGERFAHVLVTCQLPACYYSYEPPRKSTARRMPPAKYDGRWKAWHADCTCIKEMMISHGNN